MSTRAIRRAIVDGESGQTIVLTVVMLVVMLAFAGVCIDGGNFLVKRRDLQGNADAAALAAAQDLTISQSTAEQTARHYVTDNNANDGAYVDSVVADSSGRITVQVRRVTAGNFLGLFGMSPPVIKAKATAELAQMAPSAATGMLPMAFMRDNYTLGTNSEVKFDGNQTGNRGAIAPDNTPDHCVTSSGAADFRELIMGASRGGMDSCAYEIGELVSTEPGNMSGPTRQGFDIRIPASDTDSFDDVMEYDAAMGRYIIKKPNSPRVGIVPIIENTDGSTTWPNGRKDVRIVGYVQVYIGESSSGHPAYTDNGKSVWVTPVRTLLPKDFAGNLTTWSSSSDAPVAIHLVG